MGKRDKGDIENQLHQEKKAKKKKKKKKNRRREGEEDDEGTGLGCATIYGIVVTSLLVVTVAGYEGYRFFKHKALENLRMKFLEEVNLIRKDPKAYIEGLKTDDKYKKKPYELDKVEPTFFISKIETEKPEDEYSFTEKRTCTVTSTLPTGGTSTTTIGVFEGCHPIRMKPKTETLEGRMQALIDLADVPYGLAKDLGTNELSKTVPDKPDFHAKTRIEVTVCGVTRAKACAAALVLSTKNMPATEGRWEDSSTGSGRVFVSKTVRPGIFNMMEGDKAANFILVLLDRKITKVESFSVENVKVGDKKEKLWRIVFTS